MALIPFPVFLRLILSSLTARWIRTWATGLSGLRGWGAGYYYRNVYHIEAEEITITTVIYGKRLFGTSDQALTANKTHRPRGLNKFRVAYIVTRFFFHNGVLDKVDDLFARGAGANKVAEVVFGG